MKPIHFLKWALVLALCFAPLLGARAQTAAPAPAVPSAAQLQQLVTTLKDDKARAQLIDQLQALIAAQNAQQQAAAAEPQSWLAGVPAQLDAIGGEVLAAVPILAQAPQIGSWIVRQIEEPRLRAVWLDVGGKLLAILLAGLAADLALRLLLRPPARFLNERQSETLPMQLLLLALAIFAELVPVLAFAAVALFVIPLTEAGGLTRGIAGVLIATTVWARSFLAVARVVLLSPRAQLLYPLGEETREYLYIWMRRFSYCAGYGYAIALCAWYFDAPGAIVGLLTRLVVLLLAILAIIFVLQNRGPVAEWLRGGTESSATRWRVLRNRLGDTWHVLAIIYVIGTFGIYLLNAQGGFALLLRATALSLVVVSSAAILARLTERALRSGFAVGPDLRERFPHLEARANRYTVILTGASVAAIYTLAALALLEAWGIGAFTWFVSLAQAQTARNLISLAIVLVGGVVLWEFFSSVIERRLAGIENGRRSRARTVLPLLRTTVFVILLTIAVLMVLSQIGLNIAPLLAGAGIVGIAVGFGAQALVKDIITGFFMLLEDTFAIGDRVDVGSGHVGVIEAVSLRNFRLRDIQGAVHTIPFSAITTVLNMSRDFAYLLCDAGVTYREDPDRVIKVMREVGEEFAAEPRWARYVMAPLEILGVDRFTDTAMVIRARMKAAPPFQVEMGREFNRLLKKAFDRAGIEMASTNQLNYLKQPTSAALQADAAAAGPAPAKAPAAPSR